MGLIEVARLQLSSMRVFSTRERFIYDNARPRIVRCEFRFAAFGSQALVFRDDEGSGFTVTSTPNAERGSSGRVAREMRATARS